MTAEERQTVRWWGWIAAYGAFLMFYFSIMAGCQLTGGGESSVDARLSKSQPVPDAANANQMEESRPGFAQEPQGVNS